MNNKYLNVYAVILLLILPFLAQAENWPNWRGPKGDGTSSETNLPVKWDSVTNVLWKVPIQGIGHASPVIWGERLFTVTANPETQVILLFCSDTNNGAL